MKSDNEKGAVPIREQPLFVETLLKITERTQRYTRSHTLPAAS